MFNTLNSWLGRPTKRSVRPRNLRTTLGLTVMEARDVPAVLHAELVNAFNTGISIAKDVNSAAAVVQSFTADIPLLNESIASATKVANEFTAAFGAVNDALTAPTGPTVNGVDAEFANIVTALKNAVPGTTVSRFSLTPDANNDLVRINFHAEKFIDTSFTAGGSRGFSFLDDRVNGEFKGGLKATQTKVVIDINYGVDVVNGVPTFYVADGSKITVGGLNIKSVDPSSLQPGKITGDFAIRSLANVHVEGDVDVNLAGQVSLVDNKDGVADKHVRLSALAASATGDLNGSSVKINNVSLTAKVPVFGEITFTGKFAGNFSGTTFSKDDANTQVDTPDPIAVLKQAVKGVLGSFAGDNLPIFPTGVKDALKGDLPGVGNIDLLNKLGLNSVALTFANVASTISNISGTLDEQLAKIKTETDKVGLKLLPGVTTLDGTALTNAVKALKDGNYVDLVSFSTSGEITPLNASQELTPVSFPILPGVVGQFKLKLEEKAGVKYFVGVGFDTTGIYIDPRTSLSLNGSIQLSAEASVKLFGVAGVSLSVGAGVGLDAGVKINDPDPTDGKIYFDEILDNFATAKDDFSKVPGAIADSMSFFVQGNLTGNVRAELDIPFLPDVTLFEKQFKSDAVFSTNSDKKVLTPGGKSTFRTNALFPSKDLNVDALVDNAGVLRINASGETNGANVDLSIDNKTGKVKVVWFGQGVGTAVNKTVTKVIFTGSSGADRLAVSESFPIVIEANGGEGNDQLQGGALADKLDGGGGADELLGRAGNDTLTGGSGRNTIRGGFGNDIIRVDLPGTPTPSSDDNALFGDEDNDNITGGAGSDQILGGAGVDTINAGNGNNVVFGGADRDIITTGTGQDIIDGGLGNDTINAGDNNDLIIGGDGNDTLIGGLGDDRIVGDAGADRLEGGAGNDILRGGDGNDVLIGNAGNDILSGGKGTDSLFGDDQAAPGAGIESGIDNFEISFEDADTLQDTLVGGQERDHIVISGKVNEQIDPNLPIGDANTGTDVADDIFVTAGTTAGVFKAGRRDLGSTAAYQFVSFTVPTDIDDIIVRAGGGNDRIEIAESLLTTIKVDGGLGDDTILGGGGNDLLYGNAGNDTIDGRGGNDEIYGDGDNGAATVPAPSHVVFVDAANQGNDTLFGGNGNDSLVGHGGADRIDGGKLRDFVNGDNGDDVITNTGDTFGDQLDGGAGNDVIIGGDGSDQIQGRTGNDTLLGGGGKDTIEGNEDGDVIVGESGRDLLIGGSGNDTIKAFLDNALRTQLNTSKGLTLAALTFPTTQAEASALSAPLETERTQFNDLKLQLEAQEQQGGLTPEQLAENKKQQTLVANHLNDLDSMIADLRLYATNDPDILRGEGGDDTLIGSPFNDSYEGGADKDTLIQSDLAQFGGDTFNGGEGDFDTFVINGTALADAITFLQGRDDKGVIIDGVIDVFGNGGVKLGSYGRAGEAAFLQLESIRVEAGDGDDTIDLSGLGLKIPVTGLVELVGGNGNDIITAASYEGPTLLDGGNGNDTLTGGKVADTIYGGFGNDTITGGSGNDTIYGDTLAPVDQFGLPVSRDSDTAVGGNDTITGGDGSDYIDAGAGDDTVYGDDSLGFGSQPGLHGNDTIYGRGGIDNITAGLGADYVDGGNGNDTIRGDSAFTAAGTAADPDNDILIGGIGADILFGSGGNDSLYGNKYDGADDGSLDTLDGGAGYDVATIGYKGPKEQFAGIEAAIVAKPSNVTVMLRNDFSVVAVETATKNVYVGGVLSSDKAIGVQKSPDGRVLYIQTTTDSLIGFTASGRRVVMYSDIDSFQVLSTGQVRVTYTRYKGAKLGYVTETTTLAQLPQ